MPTYEYKCQDCGCTFERFQSIKDEPVAKCPACGGKVQRLIGSEAAAIFRGSGFHAKDYAKNNAPACGRDRPCCGRDKPCES